MKRKRKNNLNVKYVIDDKPSLNLNKNLGQISFVCKRNLDVKMPVEMIQSCAEFLQPTIDAIQANLFLFLTHDVWLPDTKITHYKKLWKSYVFPNWLNKYKCDFGTEYEIVSSEGVRYAGLTPISVKDFSEASETARANDCTVIFISENDNIIYEHPLSRLIHCAFPLKNDIPVTSVDWTSLSNQFCSSQDGVLRIYGRFDDAEASIDFISEKNGHLWNSFISTL